MGNTRARRRVDSLSTPFPKLQIRDKTPPPPPPPPQMKVGGGVWSGATRERDRATKMSNFSVGCEHVHYLAQDEVKSRGFES